MNWLLRGRSGKSLLWTMGLTLVYAGLFGGVTGWGAFDWQWWALCAPVVGSIGLWCGGNL